MYILLNFETAFFFSGCLTLLFWHKQHHIELEHIDPSHPSEARETLSSFGKDLTSQKYSCRSYQGRFCFEWHSARLDFRIPPLPVTNNRPRAPRPTLTTRRRLRRRLTCKVQQGQRAVQSIGALLAEHWTSNTARRAGAG